METRNVIAAISLSAAVIILYSLFFAPEPIPRSQNVSEENKIEKNSDAPSLEQKESIIKISRDEAIIENVPAIIFFMFRSAEKIKKIKVSNNKP